MLVTTAIVLAAVVIIVLLAKRKFVEAAVVTLDALLWVVPWRTGHPPYFIPLARVTIPVAIGFTIVVLGLLPLAHAVRAIRRSPTARHRPATLGMATVVAGTLVAGVAALSKPTLPPVGPVDVRVLGTKDVAEPDRDGIDAPDNLDPDKATPPTPDRIPKDARRDTKPIQLSLRDRFRILPTDAQANDILGPGAKTTRVTGEPIPGTAPNDPDLPDCAKSAAVPPVARGWAVSASSADPVRVMVIVTEFESVSDADAAEDRSVAVGEQCGLHRVPPNPPTSVTSITRMQGPSELGAVVVARRANIVIVVLGTSVPRDTSGRAARVIDRFADAVFENLDTVATTSRAGRSRTIRK